MKKSIYIIVISMFSTVGTFAQITQFPYCEDFEGGDGDWVSGGTGSTWEYGAPAGAILNNANSGANCWMTNLDGDHGNTEQSYLVSPAMDFSELYDPVVGFYIARDLEQGVDGVAFQYSTDNGSSWTLLGEANTPIGWYDDDNINGLTTFGETHGWTGYDSLWVFTSNSLDTIAGATNVKFRFIMGSDAIVTNEGFGFDDFIIAESVDISLAELIVPDSICGSSGDEIQAIVCNNSIIPMAGFSVYLKLNETTIASPYDDTLDVCSCALMSLMSIDSLSGGDYEVSAYASTANDVNHLNDSLFDDMYIYEYPDAYFSGAGGAYCAGDTAHTTLNVLGAAPFDISYTDGDSVFVENGVTYDSKSFKITQTSHYTVLNIVDASGCMSEPFLAEDTLHFKFYNIPEPSLGEDVQGKEGPVILDAGQYNEYVWSTGDSTRTIEVMESGRYAVTVANTGGCEGSDEINVTLWPMGHSEIQQKTGVVSYPNPVSDQLFLRAMTDQQALQVSIVNVNGSIVWQDQWNMPTAGSTFRVPVADIASGVYILNYGNGEGRESIRFVKE